MITTSRLVLRPLADDDRGAFRALMADPRVTGEGRVVPREDADALLDVHRACWREDGIGYGAVTRRADRAFAGVSGLALCPGDPGRGEIGWAILPAFQGQGFATEAAGAWIDHGFDRLGLVEIIALTSADNPRSLRVIERLGFQAIPGFQHPDGQDAEGRLAFTLTPALRRDAAAK